MAGEVIIMLSRYNNRYKEKLLVRQDTDSRIKSLDGLISRFPERLHQRIKNGGVEQGSQDSHLAMKRFESGHRELPDCPNCGQCLRSFSPQGDPIICQCGYQCIMSWGEGVPMVISYIDSTRYVANYRSFIDSLFLLFVFNEGGKKQ